MVDYEAFDGPFDASQFEAEFRQEMPESVRLVWTIVWFQVGLTLLVIKRSAQFRSIENGSVK